MLIGVTLQYSKGFLSENGGLLVIFIGGSACWPTNIKGRPLDGQLVEVEDAGANEVAQFLFNRL